MRKLIAAMKVSLDGPGQGLDGVHALARGLKM